MIRRQVCVVWRTVCPTEIPGECKMGDFFFLLVIIYAIVQKFIHFDNYFILIIFHFTSRCLRY